MANNLDTISLEEQLRQDRRLAANHRRRKRLRWMIPTGIALILLIAIILLATRSLIDHPDEQQVVPLSDATVTLTFVGDICLDETAIEAFRTEDGFDFTPIFRRVTTQLTSADLSIGNLEGNISDTVSDYNYPPDFLSALYASGFDILQTANSFSIQNGIAGLIQTKQAITAAGMESTGTFSSQEEREESGGVLIREVNGIRFAFLAFTKGMNNLRLPEGAEYAVNLLYQDYDTNYTEIDRSAIVSVIEQAQAYEPDVIVALLHWGSEYTQEISSAQKDVADLLFRNGVDLIVGSHSHYVGPMENDSFFHGRSCFVAYSLGDFLSAADSFAARNGCILTVRFERRGQDVAMKEIRYTPTFSAEPNRELKSEAYEIYNSLDAIAFYENGYYDHVSDQLYEKLKKAVEQMETQTGAPDLQATPQN